MLIVSDASPLRYLIELGVERVLPRLYERILTTPQVLAELRMGHFPDPVRDWATAHPLWLEVEQPHSVEFLEQLDEGEASALSLARERAADLILIDERTGSEVARSFGIKSIGTLAVLQEAGYEGLIDFHDAIKTLTTQTRFRYTDSLIARVVADYQRQLEARATMRGEN